MPRQLRTEGPTCGEFAILAVLAFSIVTSLKSCEAPSDYKPPDNSGFSNYYYDQTGDSPIYWQYGQVVDEFRRDGQTGTIYQYSFP